jgi:predicted nucleic acid-binding protein
MKLAYVDSCVWITLIEGRDTYRSAIRRALAELAGAGWELCTSDAVRLEVLIRPQRLGDQRLIDIYRGLLDVSRSLPVAPTVFSAALDLAARDGLKAMDAVHVAIAEQHGCEEFVTTDPHLRGLTSIAPHLIALPSG